jgi:hypothetical protein
MARWPPRVRARELVGAVVVVRGLLTVWLLVAKW